MAGVETVESVLVDGELFLDSLLYKFFLKFYVCFDKERETRCLGLVFSNCNT